MAQLSDSDKVLIQEAQGYVYHVLFKENMFHPEHDVTCFTLPQLITAFREGFDYLGKYDNECKRLYFSRMDVLMVYRAGLTEFVNLGEVPELALLLSYPRPNV